MKEKNGEKIRRFFVCRKDEKFVKKVKTWQKVRKTLAKKQEKGYHNTIKSRALGKREEGE